MSAIPHHTSTIVPDGPECARPVAPSGAVTHHLPPYPLARRGLAELAAVVAVVLVPALAAGATRASLLARVDEQRIVMDAQNDFLARLRPLAADEDDITALRAERDRVAGQLVVFDKLERARHGVVRALDVATRGHMTPPRPGDRHKLWVTSYRESGGYVSMQGYAIDNADISERMRELQKDEQFSDVQLCFTKCDSTIEGVPWYPFEVGMKVDYAR